MSSSIFKGEADPIKAEFMAQVAYLKARFPKMPEPMIREFIHITLRDEDYLGPIDELEEQMEEARKAAIKIMKENQSGPETVRQTPLKEVDFDEQTLPSVNMPWDDDSERED